MYLATCKTIYWFNQPINFYSDNTMYKLTGFVLFLSFLQMISASTTKTGTSSIPTTCQSTMTSLIESIQDCATSLDPVTAAKNVLVASLLVVMSPHLNLTPSLPQSMTMSRTLRTYFQNFPLTRMLLAILLILLKIYSI